jgi:hypothetical protein
MEKPKCRLCGSRHLGSEPHKFGDGEPKALTPPFPPRVERVSVSSAPATNLRATASDEEIERALRFYRKHRERQRDAKRRRRGAVIDNSVTAPAPIDPR